MWRPARRTTNATGHSCWPPGLPDYVPLRHWVRAHPVTHPTHSDAYQPITGTQFSHTPACIWTWVVLMCIELSCEARQHPRGCSSVGRALRSHRRGRGFDYRQLHETLCIHSTAEGLFILFSLKFCHLAFQGADLGFAGGLLAFRGADGQVDTPPKWRNSVASKPFVLVLHRMRSPLKRK